MPDRASGRQAVPYVHIDAFSFREEEYTEKHVCCCQNEVKDRRKADVRLISAMILAFLHSRHAILSTIIVDTGKTFQAAALDWFPKYGLRRIDAVLITHGHADGVSVWSAGLSRSNLIVIVSLFKP
jgi:glyoxylase-like metal-dependent hydrolase (beta-lactamase superfamily II)